MANSSTVEISVSHGQTIAFSAFGILLKQREVSKITEIRGYMDETTAQTAAAAAFADTTTMVTLYHATVGGGFVMASVLTGTLTTAVASRANEANMWKVVKTTTTYTYTSPSGSSWSTTRPSAGTGNIISISNSRRAITTVGGYTLFAQETTSTREYRGCTAAEANYLLVNRPADTLADHIWRCVHVATELGRVTIQTGHRYTVDSRFVSDAEGYNVSIHDTEITASGTNWSQLS